MTNGCSFTRGVYDNFNEHDAWPWQLANLTGMELDQLAVGGGSNARIFRTTIEYLLDNTPDYAVMAWTQHDRHELPYHTGDIVCIMHNAAIPEIDGSVRDIPRLREFWYKYCDNNIAALERTVYYIRSLVMLFEAKMIPYTMCWAIQCDYITQLQQDNHPMCRDFPQDRAQVLAGEINKMQTANWLHWGSSMEEHLTDFPKTDQLGHPGIEGHTEWAKQIYETLYTTR